MDHDVFLCCSEQDLPATDCIRDSLELRGVHCWFAPLDNPSGSFSKMRKGKAIARSKAFALIFSTSTNFSRMAECESAFARKLGRPIVVIRLDNGIPGGRFPMLLRGAQSVNVFGHPPRDRSGDILTLVHNAKASVPMDAELPDWESFPTDKFTESAGSPDTTRRLSARSSSTRFVPVKIVPVLNPGVRFSLVIPAPLAPGDLHILLVSVHMDDRRDTLLQQARMVRANGYLKSVDKERAQTQTALRVQIELHLPGFVDLDEFDEVLWNGTARTAGFGVRVPADLEHGVYDGYFVVKVAGIPIARLAFTARVGDDGLERGFAIFDTQPYQSAFASYSAEDDIAVLARARDLQKSMPHLQLFLNSPAMKHPWEREERLKGEIAKRDVLYLFWSSAAKRDRHVEQEWRLALGAFGPHRVILVPLVDTRIVLLPAELACLESNDNSGKASPGAASHDCYYTGKLDALAKAGGGAEDNDVPQVGVLPYGWIHPNYLEEPVVLPDPNLDSEGSPYMPF